MSSNARSALSKPVVLWLLAVALTATLGWIGYALHFTTFMLYDDEGYVLITLRDYGLHGGLYEEVYSQYGPIFYLYYDALQNVLGFEWTNTTGRWITLLNWLGTSLVCGWIVQRACRSTALAFLTLAGTFAYLWVMINEPMHPGSTLTWWLACAAWAGYEALRARKLNVFAAVGGIAGAALALVKINVGVFLIVPFGLWLLLGSGAARSGPLRLALILFSAVLPAALMRTLLGEAWVQIFVVVAGCAIVSTLLLIQSSVAEEPVRWRSGVWFIGCGLAVTGAAAAGILFNGTSLHSFWNGVFLAPLKHPTVYSFPMFWRFGVVPLTLAALALSFWVWRKGRNARVTQIVAWTRIVTVLLLQLTLLPKYAAGQAATSITYGIPLAGLFALPLLSGSEHRAATIARAWLALLLVFQVLQMYPVAGSQMNWGSFLWLPLMALGFHEAVLALTSHRPNFARRFKFVLPTVAALGVIYMLWLTGWHAQRYRNSCEYLEIPGAEKLRAPEQIASALRVVAENAREHADVLFSLPGTYSLNLWSGVPTPTLANTTHWFSLLSAEQQAAWLERIKAAERPVFVVQHNILAALINSGFRPQSPVLDYVRDNFQRAFAVEGYSFWVRNGRTIAPLSTGTLELVNSSSAGRSARVELTVSARPGKITSVELWNVRTSQWLVMTLNAENTRVDITPVHLDDRPAGEKMITSWPVELHQLVRLGLEFPVSTDLPPDSAMEVVFIGESGDRLGYVRLLPANGLRLPAFTPPDAAQPKAD